VEAEQAADGADPGAAAPRPRADGFDDVFGSAIARAVRRAVDGVGREPFAVEDVPVEVGAPVEPAPAPEPEPEPAPVASPPAEPPAGTTDPYEIVGVDRRAPWEAITASYKARARAWHPDGAPPEEQERRHELLRDLNAAYAELRVRRGR
jgi:hypothetical protein